MVSVEIELSDASDSSAASARIDCADFFSFGVFFFFVVLFLDFDFDFVFLAVDFPLLDALFSAVADVD